jgi:hypothetical protein
MIRTINSETHLSAHLHASSDPALVAEVIHSPHYYSNYDLKNEIPRAASPSGRFQKTLLSPQLFSCSVIHLLDEMSAFTLSCRLMITMSENGEDGDGGVLHTPPLIFDEVLMKLIFSSTA